MRTMCGFCDTIYDSGDPEQREMHSHGTAAPERAESETQPIPVPPEYGRHVFAYRRGYECGLAARRMSPPSGRLWGTEDAIQAFQAGWRAGRDARPAPSTDALWRAYEEARDTAVSRAFRDGRAGVPDDDESDAMTEARARLDAAVRALAAAPPAEPQRIDLMEHLREFLSRRTVQECIARELVRRYGVPPEGDEGEWYPGDSWLEDADALLRMAAAPREREGEEA